MAGTCAAAVNSATLGEGDDTLLLVKEIGNLYVDAPLDAVNGAILETRACPVVLVARDTIQQKLIRSKKPRTLRPYHLAVKYFCSPAYRGERLPIASEQNCFRKGTVSFYEEYKPFRNHMRQFDLVTSVHPDPEPPSAGGSIFASARRCAAASSSSSC